MPGLNQLKKFSSDVANLGNELEIRTEKGEEPVQLALPVNISEEDDSDDFILGLPEQNQDSVDSPEEQTENDSDSELETVDETDDYSFPELDSILNPVESDLDLEGFPELESALNPKTNESLSSQTDDFAALTDNLAALSDEFANSDDLVAADDFAASNDFATTDNLATTEDFSATETVNNPTSENIQTTNFDLPESMDSGTGGFASENAIDNLDEIPNFSVDTNDSSIDFASFDVPDAAESVDGDDNFGAMPHEVFEAPEDPFDGNPPVSDNDDEMLPGASFDDFDIPGFSDQTAGAAKARPSPKSNGQREKNTLTDSEYEQFRKNLSNYPLNLRIALQEFIVNDEFKDNVVFEVIQKVLKKVSARQLAQQLEKLLDISIPVPRDFERRTFDQYEEYKKSAEYQLKNRILPAILLGTMAAAILFFLGLFIRNAVYRPLKAESLYKEGYALIENGAYPQSEQSFRMALDYQPKKRWFFKYAEAYRNHKQYERARNMYNSGLLRFNNDKQLGLDYAEMEVKELRNFEEAERVVRREVLDYHINDKDGMLLLGDIFLEWGDEKDPTKYQEAFQIYSELLQLYGQEDIYLSRMLRYYIRVDDLRNVLQLKNYFYPKKKSLGGQDLVELSGYLLSKLMGSIAPADEYLLSSIEDVRELLERAVEAAPEIPESLYNMGLYFDYRNNNAAALDYFEAALDVFENAEYKPRSRLLKQIDTYRLIGELYWQTGEHITTEEYFRTGIDLFETNQKAGLTGNRNVGLLYADLADLNYFISGDLDEALKNYLVAVDTHNDTPSVRYKIGYIQYAKGNYSEALGSFIKTVDSVPSDTHVLLALGNVLSVRGDNFAAQGYYERLMQLLDAERSRYGIMFPQTNKEHADIVETYLKASNNLGVTLYRLARQTGDSALNASALANLTASLRAWDAMTRNQETMVRLPGSNLAERNIAYMSYPMSDYEPSIYTEIPRILNGETIPE